MTTNDRVFNAAYNPAAKIPIDQDNRLLCAGCGGDYLHLQSIETFNRAGEDSTGGLHVTIAHLNLTADGDLEGNPSSRRGGVLLFFWCEYCHAISVMAIAQHKGQEFAGWFKHPTRYTPPDEPDEETGVTGS